MIERPEIRDYQRRERRAQFDAMRTAVRAMQPVDARRVDEVFQFRLRDRRLDVAVPQPEWVTRRGGQFRVEIADLPGPAYFQLSNVPAFHRPGRLDENGPNANGPNANGPDAARRNAVPMPVGSLQVFAFAHSAMPDPDTLTTLSIQSTPDRFSVDQTTQSAAGHEVVRLVEQRNPDLPGGVAVQLWVTRSGTGTAAGAGGAGPLALARTAADFPALARAHPGEVERHVRPLFARLGQEQVFAPDPAVVRQVLADQWPIDPAAARRVAAVLPDADHADYRVRERAVEQLVALGRPGASVLLRLDRTGFSAARNLAVDRALAGQSRLPPTESARLRADVGFLADCLYSDDAAVRDAALQQLRASTGRPDLQVDPAAAPAARFAAVRAIRARLLGSPTTRERGR